jgi:hypothetical protein
LSDTIKVLIVNEDGQYLSGTATHWHFTDDRAQARVFDYGADHVQEMLEMVRNAHGTIWIAVRLDPREAYEFCDRCGSRMTAWMTHFTGTQFLCFDCLAAAPQ